MKLCIGNDGYILERHDEIDINLEDDIQTYNILEVKGNLTDQGYVVLNNIYVNDTHTEEFEERFLNRTSNLADTEGFQALRVLKPQSSSAYVILTLWNSRDSFTGWQNSQQYQHTHKQRGTSKGMDKSIVDREKSYNIGYDITNV